MALNEECSRVRELTSLELDGALSLFETAGLRRHLKACADCRAYARDVRQATALLRSTALVARPAPVTVPAAERGRARRGAVRVGSAAAVVASLAALAAGGLTTGGTPSASTGATASGSGDLSSMRAIRRQQLAVSTAADTPRIRVIEID
jgi:predicted anti-sigma-YlaC factor YlaD